MKILNLGILAHVDAGKTTLTERLLFDAGVIDTIGSVDAGSTQTDSMDLERQRGITIKSAVVSFTINGSRINLIDTPGHPEFISEVARALRVLDGAVLVISAVEGVQAQTRILMRTLTRLGVPTLLFVNKIDRMGARDDGLLDDIRRKLTPYAITMNGVTGLGTPTAHTTPYGLDDPTHFVRVAETLAEHDDEFLAAYVNDDGSIGTSECVQALVDQTGKALVHPVYFGSARTGVGVAELVHGMRELLPATIEATADDNGSKADPLRGTVFKIERGPSGEKVAFVRLDSGAIESLDHVTFSRPTREGGFEPHSGKVTAIRVFEHGATPVQAPRVTAGNIAKLWGLKDVRIGDRLGDPLETPGDTSNETYFSPPTLETVVKPRDPAESQALFLALQAFAEQDPFIATRHDDEQHEISVCLYGEVQKEVLEAQLATDFGIDVYFEETRTIYVERPIGIGEVLEEVDKHGPNDYLATIGLRIEPAQPGSGVRYYVDSELGTLLRAFHVAVEEGVYQRLRQGLYGWEVIDCEVALTRSRYYTGSTAWDFRMRTPLVLMRALRHAGTQVCEPIERFDLEVPPDTLGSVLAKLAELGATPDDPTMPDLKGDSAFLEGVIASDQVHEFERRLPGLTRGEGIVLTEFAGYRPVGGPPPRRKPLT